MMSTIRAFLSIEAMAFLVAASVHFGLLVGNLGHRQAAIAESVIAAVLLVTLMLTWIRRGAARGFGLAGQALALLGTLIGAFTIAIGVGPRTPADIAFHGAIVLVLVAGLVVALRAPTASSADKR